MHSRHRPGEASRALAAEREYIQDAAFRVALSRLKKKGWVENKNSIWSITKKGLSKVGFKAAAFPAHSKKVKTRDKGEIIIIFDIPEKFHNKRDWLRVELIALGFKLLQKSVWFGPAPLPIEFTSKIKELGVMTYMKFFEAKETDII